MNRHENSPELSLASKVLYCQGCLGQNIVNLAVVTWAIYFYAPPEGAGAGLIPVGIAGILMGAGRFFDVLSDPLIGYLSDNATSSSGRRRPFILWGAPITAVTFFLIWTPPFGHMSVWNAVWLFIIVNTYFTAMTIAGVPYRSVIPDIASTSKDRLAISMGMALFGSVGALIGAGLTGPVIQSFGYIPMGLILGAIACGSFWLALKGVKEKPRSAEDLGTKLSIFGAVRETLKNRQFLAFAVSIFSFQVGFQMFMIIIPYFVRVILGRPVAQVAIFQGSFVLVMMVSLPLWLWAGTRIGKRKGQLLALILLAVLFPMFYFIGYLPLIDPYFQALIYFCITAVPVSGLYVFPNAIVGDITDFDEKITRKRREAMYYGGFGFVEKSAWAASAFLVGMLLERFGYSVDNPMGIRLVGPLVGVIALIGFLAFLKYTLPDNPVEAEQGSYEAGAAS
jgi:glycoside/pentoside/hexuronide:cation symporter, GPH family